VHSFNSIFKIQPQKITIMNTVKLVTGLMISAVAGAALGALFSSGKKTDTKRKTIKDSGDLKDSIKDKIDNLVESIAEQFELAEDKIKELSESGKKQIAVL